MTPEEATEAIINKLEMDAADLWYPRTFYDDAREDIRKFITAAVEAEREAIRKAVIDKVREYSPFDDPRSGVLIWVSELIRDRSTADAHSAEPAAK